MQEPDAQLVVTADEAWRLLTNNLGVTEQRQIRRFTGRKREKTLTGSAPVEAVPDQGLLSGGR